MEMLPRGLLDLTNGGVPDEELPSWLQRPVRALDQKVALGRAALVARRQPLPTSYGGLVPLGPATIPMVR